MTIHPREIVAHVIQLAESDPSAFAKAEAAFAEWRTKAGLFYEVDELKPVSLRPMPLTPAEDEEIRAAVRRVQGLLEKMAVLYRGDPAVRAFFPAYTQAERWLLPDHGMRPRRQRVRRAGGCRLFRAAHRPYAEHQLTVLR